MNTSDPLENHRKNLHNFYIACNVFNDIAKSHLGDTDEYKHDVSRGESSTSSFYPFFHFVDTSTSESITPKHGDDVNSIHDDKSCDTKDDGLTTKAIVCGGFPRVETDIKIDRESYCILDIKSDSSAYTPEINSHQIELSTLAKDECVPNSSSEPGRKLTSEIMHDKIKTETTEGHVQVEGGSFRVFYHENSLKLEEESSPVERLDLRSGNNSVSHSENETTFSCNHCGKTFYHKSSIARHTLKCPHHIITRDGKTCLDEMRPKKWTKTAISEKTCTICGHVARKPCELKLHFSKHTGERPFLCKECGIGFSSTSKLNRHIRNKVHAKGKFYCEPCKVYFTLKANFDRHELEHSLPVVKMKPYACPVCDKRFSRVDILRKHVDVHDREERTVFECIICERKFSRKDTLSRHIRRKKCVKVSENVSLHDQEFLS